MSRQSKNAINLSRAKRISEMHLKGEKGPSSTAPLHNKRWGYRSNPENIKRWAEATKAVAAERGRAAKTSGKAILAKSGAAAQ